MNDTPRSAPPNFVPTLTEVVRPDTTQTQTPFSAPLSVNPPMALPAEFANLLDGWPAGLNTAQQPVNESSSVEMSDPAPAMLERILLRVELSLANRLQVTVDSVVDSHMRSFKAALRAQISETVLDAVNQAVRQENPTSESDSFPR